MAIVNASELADLLDKSNAWVSKQISEGAPVLSRGENGQAIQIESGKFFDWYVEKVTTSQKTEASRLRKAQAERTEFENRVRRAEFVSVELYGETLLAVAGEVAGQMAGFPGRVSGKVVGVQDPAIVRSRLIDECNIVRSAVAAHLRDIAGITERVRREIEGRGETERSSAQDVAGPVGGSESDPAEGDS